jgi:hypothetical protein
MLQDASELDVIEHAMFDWRFPVHLIYLKNSTTFLSQQQARLLKTGKCNVDITNIIYMKTETPSSFLNCVNNTYAMWKELKYHANACNSWEDKMSTLTKIASMTAHDIFSALLGCGTASCATGAQRQTFQDLQWFHLQQVLRL